MVAHVGILLARSPLLATWSHLSLVSLVLSVGIVSTLGLLLAVVAWLALWVRSVIGTELAAGLTVLKATLLRWAE